MSSSCDESMDDNPPTPNVNIKLPELQDALNGPESNPDWTFLNILVYLPIKEALIMMTEWLSRNEHVLMDANFLARLHDEIKPPTYSKDKPGSYHRICWTLTKYTNDIYQPWSFTPTDGTPTVRPRNYSGNCSIKKGEPSVPYHLLAGVNPENPDLMKMVLRIRGTGVYQNFALIQYIYSKPDMILPERAKRRVDAHLSNCMRIALHKRKLVDALDVLDPCDAKDIDKTKLANKGRGMLTYLRSKKGPIAGTCPIKLQALQSIYPNFGVKQVSVAVLNEDGESMSQPQLKLEAWYLDIDAVRVFAKDLPTKKTLLHHLKQVNGLPNKSPEFQNQFISEILDNVTPSTTIANVCGLVMADTTFDLSDMFVTCIIGMLNTFRTAHSNKCRPIMLGFVLHPTRNKIHHNGMGKLLADTLHQLAPEKRVSCYITDGEASLSKLFEGSAFNLATALRCDVHRMGNIKKNLSTSLPEEDVKWIVKELFGHYKRLPTGEELYIGGALGEIREAGCRAIIRGIRDKYNDNAEVAQYLSDKVAIHLHQHNSLLAKMKAGIMAQFASTNVIESFNSRLRDLFKRAEGGHTAAKSLVELIKGDIEALFKASLKKSDTVAVAPKYEVKLRSVNTFHRMDEFTKKEYLNGFGLPKSFSYKDSELPGWIHRNNDNLNKILHNLECFQLPGTERFYVYNKKNFVLGVGCEFVPSLNRIVCGNGYCNQHCNVKMSPCRHVIKILSTQHHTVARKHWDFYEHNFRKQTPAQIIFSQKTKAAGKKMKPRKGDPVSKQNDPRTYGEKFEQSFTHLFKQATDEELQIYLDEEEEPSGDSSTNESEVDENDNFERDAYNTNVNDSVEIEHERFRRRRFHSNTDDIQFDDKRRRPADEDEDEVGSTIHSSTTVIKTTKVKVAKLPGTKKPENSLAFLVAQKIELQKASAAAAALKKANIIADKKPGTSVVQPRKEEFKKPYNKKPNSFTTASVPNESRTAYSQYVSGESNDDYDDDDLNSSADNDRCRKRFYNDNPEDMQYTQDEDMDDDALHQHPYIDSQEEKKPCKPRQASGGDSVATHTKENITINLSSEYSGNLGDTKENITVNLSSDCSSNQIDMSGLTPLQQKMLAPPPERRTERDMRSVTPVDRRSSRSNRRLQTPLRYSPSPTRDPSQH